MTVQMQDSSSAQLTKWLAPGQDQMSHNSVVRVAVEALTVAGSPRIEGENPEHVQALAAAQNDLPPIIVHNATMRVIDGVHRLRVAKLRGDEEIEARFFSGSEEDAFVLAVKSNIAHGLPLSLADRKAAAVRIIVSHPQWSDRMIASVAGVAARTVAEIRKRYAEKSINGDVRIGQDGRVRPINGAHRRLLAFELISDNPELPLRQVARAAGISPETARDVRNRIRRGEDPVPKRRGRERAAVAVQPERRRPLPAPGDGFAFASTEKGRAAAIQRLRGDPALRFTETGRTLLRLLNVHMMNTEEWENIGENIPPHCSSIIANLARECAERWRELADQVERKVADIA
jgi:ParB-like chromosome segregation protein Spo0J